VCVCVCVCVSQGIESASASSWHYPIPLGCSSAPSPVNRVLGLDIIVPINEQPHLHPHADQSAPSPVNRVLRLDIIVPINEHRGPLVSPSLYLPVRVHELPVHDRLGPCRVQDLHLLQGSARVIVRGLKSVCCCGGTPLVLHVGRMPCVDAWHATRHASIHPNHLCIPSTTKALATPHGAWSWCPPAWESVNIWASHFQYFTDFCLAGVDEPKNLAHGRPRDCAPAWRPRSQRIRQRETSWNGHL